MTPPPLLMRTFEVAAAALSFWGAGGGERSSPCVPNSYDTQFLVLFYLLPLTPLFPPFPSFKSFYYSVLPSFNLTCIPKQQQQPEGLS